LIAVGAVAFVASAVANVVVGSVLRAILNLPSNFAQIAPPAIVAITFIGVGAAVIVTFALGGCELTFRITSAGLRRTASVAFM
jgi:hypothetical protein